MVVRTSLLETTITIYLGLYEEVIVQFPQPSYSHVTFEGARLFAGYGFEWRAVEVLLGLKAAG